MDYALSGNDIGNLMKDLNERENIVDSKNINSNMSLKDLFKDRGHVIIWHPWNNNPNNAHWIAMIRKGKEIYYFDSFGKEHNVIKKDELKQICERENATLYRNTDVYQDENSVCCGKYCLFVVALNKVSNSFNDIEEFMQYIKQKYNGVDEYLINNIN